MPQQLGDSLSVHTGSRQDTDVVGTPQLDVPVSGRRSQQSACTGEAVPCHLAGRAGEVGEGPRIEPVGRVGDRPQANNTVAPGRGQYPAPRAPGHIVCRGCLVAQGCEGLTGLGFPDLDGPVDRAGRRPFTRGREGRPGVDARYAFSGPRSVRSDRQRLRPTASHRARNRSRPRPIRDRSGSQSPGSRLHR